MVLLFWAHLLSSTAHATIFNFWGVVPDADGNLQEVYSPPPVTDGPVINLLRDHYCTGNGSNLVLPAEVVYNDAFLNEMKIDADLWENEGKIWIGGQDRWDDKTIFADIPFDSVLWDNNKTYHGLMNSPMARLLNVSCSSGKPVNYTVIVAN